MLKMLVKPDESFGRVVISSEGTRQGQPEEREFGDAEIQNKIYRTMIEFRRSVLIAADIKAGSGIVEGEFPIIPKSSTQHFRRVSLCILLHSIASCLRSWSSGVL